MSLNTVFYGARENVGLLSYCSTVLIDLLAVCDVTMRYCFAIPVNCCPTVATMRHYFAISVNCCPTVLQP